MIFCMFYGKRTLEYLKKHLCFMEYEHENIVQPIALLCLGNESTDVFFHVVSDTNTEIDLQAHTSRTHQFKV